MKGFFDHASDSFKRLNPHLFPTAGGDPVRPSAPGAQSSPLEAAFDRAWTAIHGPPLVAEHRFNRQRRWRFDRAHLGAKVAIELEGGIWTQGRHTRGAGYKADCEKYNAAQAAGWTVFRLTEIRTSDLEGIRDFIKNKTPV